jgi:hypothetical protein
MRYYAAIPTEKIISELTQLPMIFTFILNQTQSSLPSNPNIEAAFFEELVVV